MNDFLSGYLVEVAGVALEIFLIYAIIDKFSQKKGLNKTLPLRLEVFENITALHIELIHLNYVFILALENAATQKTRTSKDYIAQMLESNLANEQIKAIENWLQLWSSTIDTDTILLVAEYLKLAKQFKRQIDKLPILEKRNDKFQIVFDLNVISGLRDCYATLNSQYEYPSTAYFQAPINKTTFEKGLDVNRLVELIKENPAANPTP